MVCLTFRTLLFSISAYSLQTWGIISWTTSKKTEREGGGLDTRLVAFGSHNQCVTLRWSAAPLLDSAPTSYLPPFLSDVTLSGRIGSFVSWRVLSVTPRRTSGSRSFVSKVKQNRMSSTHFWGVSCCAGIQEMLLNLTIALAEKIAWWEEWKKKKVLLKKKNIKVAQNLILFVSL